MNGSNLPALSPEDRKPHPRGLSARAWISTEVALVKAGLVPASSGAATVAAHIPQVFPEAA